MTQKKTNYLNLCFFFLFFQFGLRVPFLRLALSLPVEAPPGHPAARDARGQGRLKTLAFSQIWYIKKKYLLQDVKPAMTKEEEEKRRQEEEKKRRKELSEEEKQVRKFSKEKSVKSSQLIIWFLWSFQRKKKLC